VSCTHARSLSINVKVNECWVKWPNGKTTDGYPPNVTGIFDGDYIELTACIDCHQIVGMASAEDILEIIPDCAEDPKQPPPERIQVHDFEEACQVCGGDDPECPACETL
jgi:hypothetical protein